MLTATKWYVRVTKPGHPRADSIGTVRRAVLVMESQLGRFLLSQEEAHHINGIRTDDRIENLELTTHNEHRRRENNLAAYNAKPRNTKGRPFYGNQYVSIKQLAGKPELKSLYKAKSETRAGDNLALV